MVLNTLLATKKDNIIRLQCIILPQVSWSYKIFWWWWKNMSFITEDDNVFKIQWNLEQNANDAKHKNSYSTYLQWKIHKN